MDINEIHNKDELCTLVIDELKYFGVKCRRDKKKQSTATGINCRRIFRQPLHLLELTDVILVNGSVVQIPKFVADACNRILEQVETEGIFRKAGSSLRQKEIRTTLETGMPLGKSHHVIDVANVVKYFFRELPEPLIPASMQETMLRALLIGNQNDKAVTLSCLMLPTLTINTLRFFMQFLYTVSISEFVNKMSTENLAIIFTPGLMPFANINSIRFTNHIKVVQLLIENANFIGIVPLSIVNKLRMNPRSLFPEDNMATKSLSSSAQSIDNLETTTKKKKRRSDILNGFKKIVGSTIGSSENLDDNHRSTKKALDADVKIIETDIIRTPCDKSRKKRKFPETMSAFSKKKKKDLLSLLPYNSGGFLPNTPITKKDMKRSSLSQNQHILNKNVNMFVSSMERRWSIVGSTWHKQNRNSEVAGRRHEASREDILCSETDDTSANIDYSEKDELHKKDLDEEIKVGPKTDENNTEPSGNYGADENVNEMQISFTEHFSGDEATNLKTNNGKVVSDLEVIQCQYERILKETASLSIQKHKEIPQHISRDLRLRRRTNQLDIRSPSARKIGSIRRRTHDKVLLKHTKSNVVTSSEKARLRNTSAKKHLKRTRQTIGPIYALQDSPMKNSRCENSIDLNEAWISGENFFNNMTSNDKVEDDDKLLLPINSNDDHHITTVMMNNVAHDLRYSSENLQRKYVKDIIYSPENLSRKVVEDLTYSPENLPQKLIEDLAHSSDNSPGNVVRDLVYSPEKLPRKVVKDLTCSSENVPRNVKDLTYSPEKLPRKVVKDFMYSPENLPRRVIKAASTSKVPFVNRIAASRTIDVSECGRASISQLRTTNAGMVMAKAKLFDKLGGCNIELQPAVSNKRSFTTNQQSTNVSCKNDKARETKYPMPYTKPFETDSPNRNSVVGKSKQQRSSNVKYVDKQPHYQPSMYGNDRMVKTRNTDYNKYDYKSNVSQPNSTNTPKAWKSRTQRQEW